MPHPDEVGRPGFKSQSSSLIQLLWACFYFAIVWRRGFILATTVQCTPRGHPRQACQWYTISGQKIFTLICKCLTLRCTQQRYEGQSKANCHIKLLKLCGSTINLLQCVSNVIEAPVLPGIYQAQKRPTHCFLSHKGLDATARRQDYNAARSGKFCISSQQVNSGFLISLATPCCRQEYAVMLQWLLPIRLSRARTG